MDRIDKIIAMVRYLKEEGMAAAAVGPTNNVGNSGSSALGFNPKIESPPVFTRKKYAYLGKGSRSRWMVRRNTPIA